MLNLYWHTVVIFGTRCSAVIFENVQRAFSRRVFKKCGLPRVSYPERLAYLDIQSIKRSRCVSSLTMFYSVFNNFVCCDVLNDLKSSVHNNNNLRRPKHYIHTPFCRSTVRKNFFTFRTLPLWNKLTNDVVCKKLTKAFVSRLTELDLDNLTHFRF
jgi:hypothetical protein